MMAADQKIETRAWVIKPAFDQPGDARPIKSRFYHPVSYSVPCYLLIACLDSPKLTSQCMPLSGQLSQFPFNSTAKTASRMHQNTPFWAQKSKHFLRRAPFVSAEGDTPSPHLIPPRLNPRAIRRSTPGVSIRPPSNHTFWIRPWLDHEWSLMSVG